MRAPIPLGVLAACLLASCAGTPVPGPPREPSAWDGNPVVMTRFGAVRGFEDDDATWVWKAVPFARPPVGELRWKAPRDPVPWTGVREERSFHAGCTQYSPVWKGQIGGGEDCLYLNVWRPRDDAAGLPVYVWIHGGGNSIGSAAMVPDYYGNRLSSRSRLVFVSINYRLGPFGWFAHPALRAGAPADDASGNFGTLDVIQALAWIRDNIAAFGGDPGNVTIAGESAGAFNVLSLMISPRAQGLFHRAVAESGAMTTRGLDEGDARSAAAVESLLVADGRAGSPADARAAAAAMDPAALRAFLYSRTDRQILSCYSAGLGGMIDNPAIFRDGAVIPAEGHELLAQGAHAGKVPLLIGSNKEEVKLFLYLGGRRPEADPLYGILSRFGSDRWKAAGVDEAARRLAAHPGQPPVYAYQFAWGAPDADGKSVLPGDWGATLGAFHSLEVPFFLGNDTVDGVLQMFLFSDRNRPGRKALSDAMMDYVSAFARTGDPNRAGSGLPAWTPWDTAPGAPKFLVLDAGEDAAAIRMSAAELTLQGVSESLDAEVAEPLRSRALKYLESFGVTTGLK